MAASLEAFRTCNDAFKFDDDGFFTYSSTEQKRVEDLVLEEFKNRSEGDGRRAVLDRASHSAYLLRSLSEVGRGYSTLDASRTWMCYWAIHGLNLLETEIPDTTKSNLVKFIKSCETPEGGYGGGPGQMPHLAPTYAAVMALASLKTEEALASIDRKKLSDFIHKMKQPDGSFSMHVGGECDMRGTFCALSVATLCGIMTDKLREGSAEWIISCQTYEGGFGGEPGVEAHGGYAFCAVASLVLLERFRLADAESLLRWVTQRQMKFEGGFQGRTNKLVDGCYSFWQAAIFPLIDGEMARENRFRTNGLFDSHMLEEYILFSCQDKNGGLRDKPDKSRDLYHSCYVLSGLSVAQSYSSNNGDGLVGGGVNKVDSINPVFNLTTSSEKFAVSYFENLPKL